VLGFAQLRSAELNVAPIAAEPQPLAQALHHGQVRSLPCVVSASSSTHGASVRRFWKARSHEILHLAAADGDIMAGKNIDDEMIARVRKELSDLEALIAPPNPPLDLRTLDIAQAKIAKLLRELNELQEKRMQGR
jgi:hypothetical protein